MSNDLDYNAISTGVFKTMCGIDITFYPFDNQECALQFGAWSYHTHKMNLYNSSLTVNQDTYNKNGEWHIDRTEVHRKTFAYDCCPNEPFANVAFHIFLRRRHTFYVMNVILPSIMTSVLLLSIFFCTPAQKVQIGVVVLLSFRIFLLNVAADIPKTSDHIPLLGTFPSPCLQSRVKSLHTQPMLGNYPVTDEALAYEAFPATGNRQIEPTPHALTFFHGSMDPVL
jgi:hypothetical protein